MFHSLLNRIFAGIAVLLMTATSRAELLTYEKDVRPILKAHCFQCHGENGKREGSLDLRLRRLMAEGGESGPAILPGDDADSYLMERIANGEMPPGEGKLGAHEIDIIRRWIKVGAPTASPEPQSIGEEFLTAEERAFWSFQPISQYAPPKVTGEVAGPIDQFLLAELQKQQLDFSPAADRRTLIRRMTFDLHGVPPTPVEIGNYLADNSPDATARLIDRLLASPRYGERYGRHWLDLAGYADSEGYTDEDRVRPHAYRYRDYVIRAFNRDKSFDQFVVEQLAGDELLGAAINHDRLKSLSAEDVEKLTATGFLRMAPDGTASGGIDQNVARNQVVADTLEVVSTTLLGLTVACARCHNHRYDPISQADYYRLRAIFEPALDWKNWRSPAARQVSLYTDAQRKVRAEIEAKAADVDKQRLEKTKFYIARTLKEELLTVAEEKRAGLKAAFETVPAKRTASQKQLLKDHPSVANISAGSLYLYDRRRDARARKLDAERPGKVKRFVEQTREKAIAQAPVDVREQLRAALGKAAGARSPQQTELMLKFPGVFVDADTLAKYNPSAAAEIEADKKAAAALREGKAAADLKRFSDRAAEIRGAIPVEHFVRSLVEPTNHTPTTHVFFRGDHEQPKAVAPPAELSVLTPQRLEFPLDDDAFPSTGRRLAYAKHLTSGRHPLLARVWVNRIWAQHFGRGLAASLGDFGVLGEFPSHPRLLDWLANDFIRHGWQVKRLHRQILLSRAYQQASRRSAELEQVDPDNKLLGRMSVRRLESEAFRDSVLAVSGSLSDKLYGPPVPVMEDEVGQIILGKENLDGERKPTKTISLNGEEFRRSIYVQVRRSRPLAVLATFDSPTLTPNCTQRNASNVSPQPLLLMNSQFSVQYAERFAARLEQEAGGNLEQQIRLGFEYAFGEQPNAAHLEAAQEFVLRQKALFADIESGKQKEMAARRALASFCQSLLSANRFLYID